MENLTEKEKSTNYDTFRHIEKVRNYINLFVRKMLDRGEKHDQTKLEQPEVKYFAEYTDKLKNTTYDSEEYKQYKKEMDVALQHHYANNSHHPEHYKNGIDDMTLLDIVEMLVDWKAASERHNDGNIHKSIEINAKRFKMTPQLTQILENTAKELFR